MEASWRRGRALARQAAARPRVPRPTRPPSQVFLRASWTALRCWARLGIRQSLSARCRELVCCRCVGNRSSSSSRRWSRCSRRKPRSSPRPSKVGCGGTDVDFDDADVAFDGATSDFDCVDVDLDGASSPGVPV
eukprot:1476430-Pleurochrysis_carterae.AAC.1